ncbi:MAG: oligopeptide/dipeptide ABC transporter ATP-binding protein [Chloroflexota bacterium]
MTRPPLADTERPTAWVGPEAGTSSGTGPTGPVLEVRDLVKTYAQPGTGRPVRAVAGVSLDIADGEVYALVGESGSGKTTLARCVLRLLDADAGEIRLDGVDVRAARGDALRRLRSRMAVVFQDPVGSLDPRMAVRDIVAEPMREHLRPSRRELEPMVVDALEQVGLGRIHLDRRPHELSGGQCQRVAIARALASRPRLLVLDEPTSALDVSVQAQILNLLMELRTRHGLAFLLISHDLGVVHHLADRVGVLYLGRLVEERGARAAFEAAAHPYTRALLAAVPDVDDAAAPPSLIRGEPPSLADPPQGCRFHPRCWLRSDLGDPERCATVEPPLVGPGGVDVACHFADRTAGALVALEARRAAATMTEGMVTIATWQDPPHNRWGYLHVADLLPTAVISRGGGPVRELPRDERDIRGLRFEHDGAAHDVGRMLGATYTDGYLVLHEGRIVAEHYDGAMTATTPHLLQSVSKSMNSTLAGVLVGEGRLDPAAPVGRYVQELAGGSFEGCTVADLLDMRAGTRFSEAYEDLASDIRISEQVSGWRPRVTPGLPTDLRAYMAGLANAGPHGGPFDYRSILSDLLGWVVERAGEAPFAELYSDRIWSRIGAESDATIAVDPAGAPITDGGFSVTLRDLGRYGLLYLEDGLVDGRRVVPASWIERLRRPDAELAAAFGGALDVPGVTGPTTMYHDQWWVLDPALGIVVAIGIHGQIVLVHRPSRTVIVKLSTQPLPVDRALFRYQMAGSLRICTALADGSLSDR